MWRIDTILSAAAGFAVGIAIVGAVIVRSFDHT